MTYAIGKMNTTNEVIESQGIKKILHTITARPNKDFVCTTYRGLVDYRLKNYPDVPMYTYTDFRTGERTSVSSKEFKVQLDAVSTWIYEKGYNKDNIAIMGDNSYQWILAMEAIVSSNNVVILLDKSMETSILSELIDRSESKAIFYSRANEEKAKVLAQTAGIPMYCIDDNETYIAEGKLLIANGKTACLEQELDENALAVIMYTSGTTGDRKGVMLSQKNLISNAICLTEQTDLSGNQVYFLPLNHIYGLSASHLSALLTGNTLHINLNLRYMYKDMMDEKPEIIFLVPLFIERMYAMMWKNIDEAGKREKIQAMIEENNRKGNVTAAEKREMFKDEIALFGGKLSRIVSGGAPLTGQYYEGFKAFGIEILEGYGITECAPVLSVNRNELNKPGSVGRVLCGVECQIENPDSNGDGEICVKGPNVMLGYHKMEKETAEAMKGGWFHTGDKGYLDEDGYIVITGRIKNLIILSNGENISPEEIEKELYNFEAIQEVIVYAKNQEIVAQVYMNQDYMALHNIVDGEQLIRDYIYGVNLKMQVYKRIHKIEFRSEPFERTSSNKIKRF